MPECTNECPHVDTGQMYNPSALKKVAELRRRFSSAQTAVERESRPSDSDSTLRSVLSPLRPPVPDVDEQFRNLELNPPSLVLIEGDKISKEPSHESCLRAFWKN